MGGYVLDLKTLRVCAGWLMATGVALAAGPAAAGSWLKAESPHFIIYSANKPEATREYARKLEVFRTLIDSFYDDMGDSEMVEPQKTVFNYMYGLEDFGIVVPNKGRSSEIRSSVTCLDGTQYFASADLDELSQVDGLPASRHYSTDLGFMFHSYSVAYMKTRFSKPLPRWVRSGLASYFRSAVVGDNNKVILGRPLPDIAMAWDRDGHIADLSRGQRYIPYADIIAGKRLADRDNDAEALESWIMVSHLMSDPERMEKFTRYIHLTLGGMDSMQAFHEAIGIDPESFRDVLDQYRTKGAPLRAYKVDSLPAADTSVNPLPYGEPVPLLDAATRSCPTEAYSKDVLQRLKKVAPKYPDDVLAQQALARARIIAGNPEDARPWLTQRLAAAPDDFESRFLLGRMHLTLAEKSEGSARAENYAAARRELGKAYKLNPVSPPVLYYYAKSSADRPDYPSENTLTAAELAVDYATGDNYQIFLAELLVRRGDYQRARGLIDGLVDQQQPDWTQRRAALKALSDAMAARAPVTEIVALMAAWDKAKDRFD